MAAKREIILASVATALFICVCVALLAAGQDYYSLELASAIAAICWLGILIIYRVARLNPAITVHLSGPAITLVFITALAMSGETIAADASKSVSVVVLLGCFFGSLFGFPIAVIVALGNWVKRKRSVRQSRQGKP